jgi:ribosomal protein S18 acetylase RimI-like enzyme
MKIIHTEKIDLPFVYHLFDEAILYQKRKNYPVWAGYDKNVLKQDIEDKRAFKIEINDEIAAIFSITLEDMAWNDDGRKIAIYVHRVVVNPNYKGQKLFGKIVDWLLDYAKTHDLKFVRLDTWHNNPVIIDYYRSFGFELIGFQQYQNTEDIPIQMRGNRSALLEIQLASYARK